VSSRSDGWSFVTNHARVLGAIAADPNTRLRDIAETVGITERTAAHIVNDLERAGYVTKTRDGRRNRYVVDEGRKLRQAGMGGLEAAQLLALLLDVFERSPLS